MLYLPPTNLDIIPTLITSRYLQYSNCLLLITSILSTFQFIKSYERQSIPIIPMLIAHGDSLNCLHSKPTFL